MSEENDSANMPLDVRVRWEIWQSFVSLLRSYAGAASLSGVGYQVQSVSDWVKVERQDHALRFCFHPETGQAVWRSLGPDGEAWGGFHLHQDGTFEFPDGTKSMDIAVIDWIEQLGHTSSFEIKL